MELLLIKYQSRIQLSVRRYFALAGFFDVDEAVEPLLVLSGGEFYWGGSATILAVARVLC